MSRKSLFLFLLAGLIPSGYALAQASLFYLEAQGVAGYSSAEKNWIFYSLDQIEAMQKPSLGFDYIQRLSRATGDFAVLAVQARLAFNAEGEKRLEPQVYNAYLKFKLPFADLWVGHDKPALGLSSAFDTHAHLLPSLAMSGYGFDRDWGLGLNRDLQRGSWGLSLTAGSGMPLHFRGNYLLSGRAAFGVLSRDNRSLGFSLSSGRILETMGYHLLAPDPLPFWAAGADFTSLSNNIENRLEIMTGKRSAEEFLVIFWRLGANFLEEDRLKLEAQPVAFVTARRTRLQISLGLTAIINADLTLRAMYRYDEEIRDHRFVLQIYYYKRILF